MQIEINIMEFDHTKPSKAKLSKERNNPVSHHKQCYIVLNLSFSRIHPYAYSDTGDGVK